MELDARREYEAKAEASMKLAEQAKFSEARRLIDEFLATLGAVLSEIEGHAEAAAAGGQGA